MSQKSLSVSELSKYGGKIDTFDKTREFLQLSTEFIANQVSTHTRHSWKHFMVYTGYNNS